MSGFSHRRVEPEMLDALEANDARAVRSRGELRTINGWMGNFRWILRELQRCYRPGLRVVELGAGDGGLGHLAARHFPDIDWAGIDMAPRPEHWPAHWEWRQGDLVTVDWMRGDVLVANLILHHLDEHLLVSLREKLGQFDTWLINEPLRRRHAQWGFQLLAAVFRFGEVTRYDAPVSIRAGFQQGELPRILGREPAGAEYHEAEAWRGALRLVRRRGSAQAAPGERPSPGSRDFSCVGVDGG